MSITDLTGRIKNCKGSAIIDRNYMKRKHVCWMNTNQRVLIELSDAKHCRYQSVTVYTDANRKMYYECLK